MTPTERRADLRRLEREIVLPLTEREAFKLFQYLGRLPKGTVWAEPVYARLRELRRRCDVGACKPEGTE